jgi:hypothetical protein
MIRVIWYEAWLARYGFESLEGKTKRLEENLDYLRYK